MLQEQGKFSTEYFKYFSKGISQISDICKDSVKDDSVFLKQTYHKWKRLGYCDSYFLLQRSNYKESVILRRAKEKETTKCTMALKTANLKFILTTRLRICWNLLPLSN